jgi:hypothetical protein
MATSIDLLADLGATPSRDGRRWRPALARLAVPSVELLSACVLLGWSGLLLVLKPALFAGSSGYAAMAALAPERVWGVAMAALGLLQLAAVATRHPLPRLLGCGGACAMWAFVAVMLSQASGVRTGGVTYGLLAAFLLWRNLRTDG